MNLYPLKEKFPELIKSKTGKGLEDLSLESVTDQSSQISIEDVSISKETLLLQAKVALDNGRPQLAENFVRASELISVPDEEVLWIYDKLRPKRSTEKELMDIAEKLQNTYQAPVCAALVRETLEVYKKRGVLL